MQHLGKVTHPRSIVLNAAVDALGRRWRSALQLLSASRTQRVAVEMFFYGCDADLGLVHLKS
jgi:hypothetical protein